MASIYANTLASRLRMLYNESNGALIAKSDYSADVPLPSFAKIYSGATAGIQVPQSFFECLSIDLIKRLLVEFPHNANLLANRVIDE